MSVAADIRAAVKDAIDALDFGSGTAPTVVVRKRPVYRSGDPAGGLLVVSGVDVGDEPLTGEDDLAHLGRYGVAVTALIPNAAGEVPDGTAEDWIEVVHDGLDRPNPLPAVGVVVNVERRDRPWFNPAGLDKNYDYAQLALVYETAEARG